MGAQPVAKPFLPLFGKTVLRHAVDGLIANIPDYASVTIVHAADTASLVIDAMQGFENTQWHSCLGGDTRMASVAKALKTIKLRDQDDLIMVHDCARPLIDAAAIARLLAASQNTAGFVHATLALPVSATLWNSVKHTVIERNHAQEIQTPQLFMGVKLQEAHKNHSHSFTDDCSLVQASCGVDPVLITGSPYHHKLTLADDMRFIESLYLGRHNDVRTGIGFDVHAFDKTRPNQPVTLCGVTIPSPFALSGHSDADVALHALCDAIYSALGQGDIGYHFPPSDMQWKGADSALFLRHALELAAQSKAIITNVSLILLGEQPRVTPHREAILNRLSHLLNLPMHRIGLTATTTEKLGFLGRGEGLACQAQVTLRFEP